MSEKTESTPSLNASQLYEEIFESGVLTGTEPALLRELTGFKLEADGINWPKLKWKDGMIKFLEERVKLGSHDPKGDLLEKLRYSLEKEQNAVKAKHNLDSPEYKTINAKYKIVKKIIGKLAGSSNRSETATEKKPNSKLEKVFGKNVVDKCIGNIRELINKIIRLGGNVLGIKSWQKVGLQKTGSNRTQQTTPSQPAATQPEEMQSTLPPPDMGEAPSTTAAATTPISTKLEAVNDNATPPPPLTAANNNGTSTPLNATNDNAQSNTSNNPNSDPTALAA